MLSTTLFVALSAGLKFGLVFWFGIRELLELRRLRQQRDGDPPPEPMPLPLLPDPGTAPGRELPAELRVSASRPRSRELETA